MAEKVTKRLSKAIDPKGEDFVEFDLSEVEDVSSSSVLSGAIGAVHTADAEEAETDADELKAEKYSPEFLELAVPKLPVLPKENRARLLMQSPNRLYFYWSVRDVPPERSGCCLEH